MSREIDQNNDKDIDDIDNDDDEASLCGYKTMWLGLGHMTLTWLHAYKAAAISIFIRLQKVFRSCQKPPYVAILYAVPTGLDSYVFLPSVCDWEVCPGFV